MTDPILDIQYLKSEVESAVRKVLSEKHSALFGRAYNIKSNETLELAVKELTATLVFPVFKEMGLGKDNVTQIDGQWKLPLD
jgi:hypothetical protein